MAMLSEISYTPAAANTTGYASNVTGASWTLTANDPGDGLAHQVTITNDSITDHSAKTALITGTDAGGAVLTETVNLPAASATVTSTESFATVTSVVPSATIGADTMDIGWAAGVVVAAPIPVDRRIDAFNLSIAVIISGTADVTIEHTYNSLRTVEEVADAVWFPHSTLVTLTANTAGFYENPIVAFRVKFNSYTAGAVVRVALVMGS